MSYTQNVLEPSPKDVLKKCCRSTCRSYTCSDCKAILSFHKIETVIFIIMFIMFIICGVLFGKLGYQDCPDRKLLLIFGGLAYCLPVTIFVTAVIILSSMYLNKVWIAAKIEARTSMYQQHLNPGGDVEFGITRSVSSDGYAVRLFADVDIENDL